MWEQWFLIRAGGWPGLRASSGHPVLPTTSTVLKMLSSFLGSRYTEEEPFPNHVPGGGETILKHMCCPHLTQGLASPEWSCFINADFLPLTFVTSHHLMNFNCLEALFETWVAPACDPLWTTAVLVRFEEVLCFTQRVKACGCPLTHLALWLEHLPELESLQNPPTGPVHLMLLLNLWGWGHGQ